MKRVVLVVLLAIVHTVAPQRAEAGCRPRPHGPYGGPCYACGGRGLARGYALGYYSFGSWGYAPDYALGNYGYGSGFGSNPEYTPMPGHASNYDGPGYQSGYPGRRGYCLLAYYYGSGGYLHRRPCPRDYGGDYGGVWTPPVWATSGTAQADREEPLGNESDASPAQR